MYKDPGDCMVKMIDRFSFFYFHNLDIVQEKPTCAMVQFEFYFIFAELSKKFAIKMK